MRGRVGKEPVYINMRFRREQHRMLNGKRGDQSTGQFRTKKTFKKISEIKLSLDFFLNVPNPSSCTMAPGFTQPVTEISTRRYFWG
jgi:hypothetical protein